MADLGISVAGPLPVERQGAAVRPRTSFALLEAAAAGSIVPEWRELAARAAEDNVFFDPDLILPALLNVYPGVAIATARTATGRLLALAPVVRSRLGRVAPGIRLFSHDYGPLGTPLLDAADLETAAAALVEGVAPRQSLVVPELPLDGPVAAALLAFANADRRPVAIVDLHERAMFARSGDATDARALLSTRRRKEYQRLLRRLADEGALEIESTVEPDRVRARFEEFLALEAAGWKGRAGTALSCSVATATFARAMVFNRSETGRVRIDSLRLGARPLAILVSFVAARTAYTWKIAYSEAFARYSPGAQLMLDAPRGLFGDPAIRRIDSCAAPNHPMIDHLWKDRLRLGTLVIGPPGGSLAHRLGLAAFRAEIDSRHAVRRLRDRIKGHSPAKETD